MVFFMKRWEQIDSVEVPGGGELVLVRRGEEFVIRADGLELMTSRVHGSEDALAEFACVPVSGRHQARVLIGGLGMGFTLAAALKFLRADARVEVAEMVPGVVKWNREHLGHLAGHPLDDPRVTLRQGDFAAMLKGGQGRYDAIMNDVDNGPQGVIVDDNNWLYSRAGLLTTYDALRPGGRFTVWSVGPDSDFTGQLRKAGFDARARGVRDSGGRKGRRHVVWVAKRKAAL